MIFVDRKDFLTVRHAQNNRKRFLRKNKEHSFVIEKGECGVVISAPHGVSQVRLGKVKCQEPGSLAIALELAKRTKTHLIAKTKNCGDDANFEQICPYKEKLKEYIAENNIKYLFDFHGLGKKRPMDINLGTCFGENIKPDQKLFDFMCKRLTEAGFSVEIDQPFKAAAVNSVAGKIARDCGIWTIQVEINCKYTNEDKYNDRFVELVNAFVDIIEYTKQELKEK